MIRFGIVGAGGIAKIFAHDILLVDGAVLNAVSARTKEKAEYYKQEYGVPYSFSSYEEMAKSDLIDAVYIATPHNFHHDLAILFMNHGKHVLVEKPIAVNIDEAKEMIEVAKRNGVMLMEAMWTHFLPSTRFVKGLTKEGDFGKLLEAKFEFGYDIISGEPDSGRHLDPKLAGGSVLDMGVYPLSFFQLIEDSKIESLRATAKLTHTGVDATTEVEILTEGNALVKIRCSLSETMGNDATLVYENGTILMKNFSRCQEVFVNNGRFEIPFEGKGFVHEMRAFVKDIEKQRSEDPIRSLKASLRTMELMDMVRNQIGLKYPFE